MSDKIEVTVTINADSIEYRMADFEKGTTKQHAVSLPSLMERAEMGSETAENSLLLWVVQGHLGQLNNFLRQQQEAAQERIAASQDPQHMAAQVSELLKTLAAGEAKA